MSYKQTNQQPNDASKPKVAVSDIVKINVHQHSPLSRPPRQESKPPISAAKSPSGYSWQSKSIRSSWFVSESRLSTTNTFPNRVVGVHVPARVGVAVVRLVVDDAVRLHAICHSLT